GLGVATAVFWWRSRRDEGQACAVDEGALAAEQSFRINYVKALIPLLPLALLFLTAPPLKLFEVPPEWLGERSGGAPLTAAEHGLFDSRLVGAAMLVGVAVAGLAAGKASVKVAGAFFDGAGYGFTHIISLIVAATCFGKGVELIGLARLVGDL